MTGIAAATKYEYCLVLVNNFWLWLVLASITFDISTLYLCTGVGQHGTSRIPILIVTFITAKRNENCEDWQRGDHLTQCFHSEQITLFCQHDDRPDDAMI